MSIRNCVGVRQRNWQTGLGLIILHLLGITGPVCQAQQIAEAPTSSLVCYFKVAEWDNLFLQECEAVSLIGISLTADRLSCLARCEKIGALELQGCLLTHHGILQISEIGPLEELSLVGTPIQDKHLEWIAQSQQLKYLDLRGTHITNRSLSMLAECRGLVSLDLRGTAVTAVAVGELKRKRPDLNVLFLAVEKVMIAGAQ